MHKCPNCGSEDVRSECARCGCHFETHKEGPGPGTPDQLLDQLRASIDRSFEGDLAFWKKYADTLEDAYRSQACTLMYYKQSNDQLLTANEEHYQRLNDEIYELREQVKQKGVQS